MATKLTSPRSASKKVLETTFDLGLLAAGISLAFSYMEAFSHPIPKELEVPTANFLMALGGTLMRFIRHRRIYKSEKDSV